MRVLFLFLAFLLSHDLYCSESDSIKSARKQIRRPSDSAFLGEPITYWEKTHNPADGSSRFTFFSRSLGIVGITMPSSLKLKNVAGNPVCVKKYLPEETKAEKHEKLLLWISKLELSNTTAETPLIEYDQVIREDTSLYDEADESLLASHK